MSHHRDTAAKVALTVTLLGVVAPTEAGVPLGVASDYNVFVFGDFNCFACSVQGSLASGNDVEIDAVGINEGALVSGTLALVSGGNVYLGGSGGAVYGDLIAHGDVTGTQGWFIDGVVTANTSIPIDFDAAFTQMQTISECLLAMDVNGIVEIADDGLGGLTITLTGSDLDENVFSLSGAQLSMASALTFAIPLASHSVVNVSESAVALFQLSMSGNFASNTIFNFSQATTLTIENTGFNGSIMAVSANITAGPGNVQGTLIGNSFEGVAGHDFPYLTTTTAPLDTDGDGLLDSCDPDDDNDGIADEIDTNPVVANNDCTDNDGINATLVGASVSDAQTCASKESVAVNGITNVGIDGDLRLISEKVSLTDTSVTDNGQMEVINADPCPGCSVCGNGVLEAWEQCDDGNTDDGDGCSAICLDE